MMARSFGSRSSFSAFGRVAASGSRLGLGGLALGWSLLLVLLPVVQVAGQAAAPFPDQLGQRHFDLEQAKETLVCDKANKQGFACAVCSVDVAQATFSIGEAAVAIRSSVKFCNKDYDPTSDLSQLKWTEDHTAACAVAVSRVLRFLSFVAGYTAAAASDCQRTLDVNGYCVAGIANLAADLATLAASGADMKLNCRSKYAWNRPRPTLISLRNTIIRDHRVNRAAHKHHRRLLEVARLPPSEVMFPQWADRHLDVAADYQKVKSWNDNVDHRRSELAACSFNIGQAVLYLMRALLGITASARTCQTPTIGREGKAGKMICAVDVSGLIGSFAWVASSISYAVTQCPITGNGIQAGCAGDLTAVVAALAGIASSGSGFALTCGRLQGPATGGRFLAASNETSSAVSEGIQRAIVEVDSMAKSLAKLVLQPSHPVLV
ncbi:unnamed protein product [Polarella glacialis]|uniref:Uncharacterized protein n=1 Tax=Polarella glacialis TaxID=89957 RepID=A0A813H8H0_POLGL|nr:unnamed protein product [Polarella glacialis]CAE8649321.1 unnamed protein product [Polarella glacialis]